MKQISGGILLSLIMALPYLLLLTLCILFFCRAVFYKGMQKMQFFTVFVSGASALFLLLMPLTRGFAGLMPVRFITAPAGTMLQWLLILALLVCYVLVFVLALKENAMRIVIYTWLVILLFNIADIMRNGYLFLTWVEPVVNEHPKTIPEMILSHVRVRRESFLYHMIYPFFWVVISLVCLAKIRKEKARLAAAPGGQGHP